MQTCVLQARGVAEISIDGPLENERRACARVRRCVLHVFAILKRPRAVQFHWQGILRELPGVERQISRPFGASGDARAATALAKTR